ncbi:hypothetical protein BDR07DRAFT_1399749 [Suillus spraguei]|nr:hypothetical protein BDR07DRAFT_1428734 [Suillus spraguei]KAG2365078.1 hypothetical protein BDR07DRAFT_1399749 [Suillus spraguei]
MRVQKIPWNLWWYGFIVFVFMHCRGLRYHSIMFQQVTTRGGNSIQAGLIYRFLSCHVLLCENYLATKLYKLMLGYPDPHMRTDYYCITVRLVHPNRWCISHCAKTEHADSR